MIEAVIMIAFIAIVFWVTLDVLKFVLENRERITCMVGMMAAMTMGMMAGLAAGTVLGSYFKQELFLSSVLGMVIGIMAGVVIGLPISLMSVMDGLMAGLMGGMMGAMLGEMLLYDHPTLMAFVMQAAFLAVVAILKSMLKQEVGLKEFKEQTTEAINRKINLVLLGAGSMIVLLLFIGTFSLRPASALPSSGGSALPPDSSVSQDASGQNQADPSAQAGSSTVNGNEQTATIQVGQGIYSPEVLTVKKGIPMKLTLAKNYSGGCQSGFVIPDFGVQTYVPKGQTMVTFTPTKAGQFPFSCSMGMFGGTLIVQDS